MMSGTKRVLVTGVTGFIGSHVLEPLRARCFEIHGTSRTSAVLPEPISHCAVDLLAPGAAAELIASVQPSHLLHLAWMSDPGRAMASPENDRWMAATLDLFRAFASGGGGRAVLAGSCAEYDWTHSWLNEARTPIRPATAYGVAKHATWKKIEAENRAWDVSAAWARIFFLYGPYEPKGRLVSELAAGLAAGRRVETTHGHQERDFLHVADAAAALVALLDGPVTGTINIASGVCVPVREVAETLGRLAGRPDLVAIGARPLSPGEPPRLAADVTRLKNEVGFSPCYRLDDGLAATLEWWRDRSG